MTRFSLLLLLLSGSALVVVWGCASDPQLVWHEEDGYRWAVLPDFDGAVAGFEEISTRQTGVDFSNTLDEASLVQNRHYMNGSGVAVGDIDGDGWTDLYFARLDGPNVLYRNRGGWQFEEITEWAGVAAPDRYSTGAVFADIDGDGDLDLLVTAMGGPNAAFLNDGTGRFTDITERAGLASQMGSTSMALADVDGDGDLDLYVANYKARAVNDIYPPWERSFERTVQQDGESFRIAPEFEDHYELELHAGGLMRVERAEPNLLYLNDGEGRFSHVPLTGGAFLTDDGNPLDETPEDWTLTVRFQDVNGDGTPDLYVCNDFHSPDYFWLNDGRGNFREIPTLALRKTSFSTMSVDFSDVDRDGHLDFFLTDMLSNDHVLRHTQVGLTIPMMTEIGEIENRPQAVQNMLHLNRGDETYAEIGRLSGVAASDWTWSGLFMDVDLDGYEDLLLATGHLYDVLDREAQMADIMSQGTTRDAEVMRRKILEYPPLPLVNVAFRNRGDLSFERVPNGWGLGVREDVSTGLAFGDFDNDGDLDVVVNRLNDTAGLFRNMADGPRIAVRLRGEAPNTQAIGSKIRVSGGLPAQEKEVISGGQYLSGSDPLYTFAVAKDGGPVTIEVDWRSGKTTRIANVPANRILEIDEPRTEESLLPFSTSADTSRSSSNNEVPDSVTPGTKSTWFDDVSDHLSHGHEDAPYDDFSRQPLLRTRMSRQGPGVAWADLDGDGNDDLLIASGRGGRVTAYLNDGNSSFSGLHVSDEVPDDVTGVAALELAGGGALVFLGISNYEQSVSDSSWIEVVEVSRNGRTQPVQRLPFGESSVGPLALADIDGDGDLDLFAGGRLLPGRYPQAASSAIYLNRDGRFQLDTDLSEPFEDIGMVSGAAFGDLDGDGKTDLVLATDWGPIRHFQNLGGGRFADRTETSGLGAYAGRWNGVSLGDFDGDGRLDIVATNEGWNGVHARLHAAEHPVRLYYGDFNADGVLDLIESVYEPALVGYVPLDGLTSLSEAMPYVSQRMRSFRQFATSTLRQIVGPKIDRAPYLEINTLANMLFLNTSTGSAAFEATPLPLEAQFAPAFASVVADFDADGHEDVYLSQNFFAFPMDIPRQDAGRGLMLRGDGKGSFEPMSGHDLGITIYGEQRGAAAGDFNADGRVDLLVSQNGAATKLYRNTGSRAGIRIRLAGPDGNLRGIGAILRLAYSDGTYGPGRLVSAGSGYRSQNASTYVVLGHGSADEVMSIEVTWPDGRRSVESVAPETANLTISWPSEAAQRR